MKHGSDPARAGAGDGGGVVRRGPADPLRPGLRAGALRATRRPPPGLDPGLRAGAAGKPDADATWLTLLPGFPDGSYGWAQVDRRLGPGLGPRLYVEPVGQGDSDKPRHYPYSTVERGTWLRPCGGTTACAGPWS